MPLIPSMSTEIYTFLDCACAVLVEQLRHRAKSEEMSAAQRRDKARIMQQILRNDAQVRLLIEPWVGELERLLRPRTAFQVH